MILHRKITFSFYTEHLKLPGQATSCLGSFADTNVWDSEFALRVARTLKVGGAMVFTISFFQKNDFTFELCWQGYCNPIQASNSSLKSCDALLFRTLRFFWSVKSMPRTISFKFPPSDGYWIIQNGKSKIMFEFIEIVCIQIDFEEAEWISLKQCLSGVLC